MTNGGYKIIDLKDVNITAVPTTIDGVHEAIENSYRKPLLLSGIVLNNVEKNDVFVCVNVSGGSYTIQAYGGTFTITSANAVSFAQNV